MPDKLRLILVYGGPSAEHDVSRVSTLHVSRAADPERFDIRLIGVTHDGRWLDATDTADRSGDALTSPDDLPGAESSPAPLWSTAGDGAGPAVVFPLIHGPMGEDGTLQGLLEIARLPYVGAGVLASAVCMEKPVAKAILSDAGLPQGAFRVVDGSMGEDAVAEIGADLGYPVFVKPSGQGSSVGVAKVHSDDALAKAVRGALDFGDTALVEEHIDGREIELAVLGNDDPECTPAGEIVPSQEFYDYEDKYVLGSAELHIPARLPEEVMERARRLAVAAYTALQVEGFGRVDLFLRGEDELLINELNTIPGFTPISMYPKLWEHEGVSYRDLISRLVDLGMERFARRRAYRVRLD